MGPRLGLFANKRSARAYKTNVLQENSILLVSTNSGLNLRAKEIEYNKYITVSNLKHTKMRVAIILQKDP
jgi:hypothetical protein